MHRWTPCEILLDTVLRIIYIVLKYTFFYVVEIFTELRWKADSVCLRDCFSQGSAPVLARPGQQNCQSSETKCRAMKSISSNILHLSTHHRASSHLGVLRALTSHHRWEEQGRLSSYVVRNPIFQKKFWWKVLMWSRSGGVSEHLKNRQTSLTLFFWIRLINSQQL